MAIGLPVMKPASSFICRIIHPTYSSTAIPGFLINEAVLLGHYHSVMALFILPACIILS